MARPKPNMMREIETHITSKGLKVVALPDPVSFNTNTSIEIACNFDPLHTYKTTISKIKNGYFDPTICPHCKKKEDSEKTGLSAKDVESYCADNNLDYSPKKIFYKKWETGEKITFTCKVCNNFAYETKSLRYWEDNTSKNKYVCVHCETGKNKLDPNNTISSSILPKALKEHILNQNKWTLVEYYGTHELASYKCNDCGAIKKLLPHNLFTGRRFGCANCNKNFVKETTQQEETPIYDY